MTDDNMEDLINAAGFSSRMRHNWAKAIAAGYKRGETETAIKAIIEVRQAIDVIDYAIEELEEAEEQDDEDDE
jgi:choline kinase